MHPAIEAHLARGTALGTDGAVYKIHSSIGLEKAEHLFNLVQGDPTITSTMEVGCAFGISSMCICLGLESRPHAKHVIIDPHQSTDWHGCGVRALQDLNIDFFELFEEPSELALPDQLRLGEERADLVFIDGWHTFDHTLLDCFYATRLLRTGGYLVLDDTNWASIRRVVALLKRYPCYLRHSGVSFPRKKSMKERLSGLALSPLGGERLRRWLSATLAHRIVDSSEEHFVVLQKVSSDMRDWSWHDDRF